MTENEEIKDVFKNLSQVDTTKHQKNLQVGGATLTYLSWTFAWSYLMDAYPDSNYEIERFEDEQGVKKPYMFDKTGYMVFTKMTIKGTTREMWLPVMDSHNKAMLDHVYTYDTKYKKGIIVEPASMFDINKTIMRCLVKNMAMFGLGLNIYSGEDLPDPNEATKQMSISSKQKADIINLSNRVGTKFDKKPEQVLSDSLSLAKANTIDDLDQQTAKLLIQSYENQLKASK
ncbi:hypothetical protein vBOeSunk162_28 [Oenococcus phage vB_OeS_unk162]|nr:hypothetical protein vBOeSunk162_28 [Oenococcus phage vB_OeS_unk162]QNO11541.1 hypothetical protein [Oenococcus phage Vinitor-27]